MTISSYEITDVYGNVFLCNHNDEYDTDDSSHIRYRIDIGSTRINPPCLTIIVIHQGEEYRVHVEGLYADVDCAEENDLVSGRKGTQSMLLCGLQMAKWLYPKVKEFELQDESHLPENETISLSDIYMMTRGKAWYESFLKVIPVRSDDRMTVSGFSNTMKQTMNMQYYDMMYQGLGKNKQMADQDMEMKKIWQGCYWKCAMYEFMTYISKNKGSIYWIKNLSRLMTMLNVSSVKGILWKGYLIEQESRLKSVKEYKTMKRFGQRGGMMTRPRGLPLEEIMQ